MTNKEIRRKLLNELFWTKSSQIYRCISKWHNHDVLVLKKQYENARDCDRIIIDYYYHHKGKYLQLGHENYDYPNFVLLNI